MGLFSRRSQGTRSAGSSYLPANVIPGLEPFGRFEFDPRGSGVDPSRLITNGYALAQLKQNDPNRFIAEIAAAAIPAGGWTLLGAMKLLWEFSYLESVPDNPDATAILMAGVELARGMGLLPSIAHLSIDERFAYARAGGNPW
jgi:hypothetical protein